MFYCIEEWEESSRNGLGKYCDGIYFWLYTFMSKLATITFVSQSADRWKYSHPALLRCFNQAEVNYSMFLSTDYKALFKASNL